VAHYYYRQLMVLLRQKLKNRVRTEHKGNTTETVGGGDKTRRSKKRVEYLLLERGLKGPGFDIRH